MGAVVCDGVLAVSGLDIDARCCCDNLFLWDLDMRTHGGRLAHQPEEAPLPRQSREDPIPERLKVES